MKTSKKNVSLIPATGMVNNPKKINTFGQKNKKVKSGGIFLFALMRCENPYQILGTQFRLGLEYLEGNITSGMDTDAINTLISDYLQTLYYPTPDQFQTDLLTTLPLTAVCNYVNNNIGNSYDSSQGYFINQMLNGIRNVPVESIGEYLSNVQDNISRSGLTMQQKMPLMMALAVGTEAYTYWAYSITHPTDNGWYDNSYLDVNTSYTASLSYWTTAAMSGVLATANNLADFSSSENAQVGTNISNALIGGMAVNAAKVMLKILPAVDTANDLGLN